jgi:lipoyl(octanoyl) transferase
MSTTPEAHTHAIVILDIGTMPYAQAWKLQRELHGDVVAARGTPDAIGGFLLLVEHPPVYTLGRVTDPANITITDDQLKALGAEKFEIDRGGDVTFHGPGQLVTYPIFDLTQWKQDLHWYLRAMEEAVIAMLATYGIEGTRVVGRTGVWVGEEKVCAIGIKCSQWVTMHGLALNVNTDLSFFDLIIPCGITDKGVTSMKKILGNDVDMEEVRRRITAAFEEVFR